MKHHHTPEPWHFAVGNRFTPLIPGAMAELHVAVGTDGGPESLGQLSYASDAERIVACVNACQDITDPETIIPALVEALRATEAWMAQHANHVSARMPGGYHRTRRLVRAALAKLEGAQQG